MAPLLAELTSAHLVTERSPRRYTWHDLLRAYAREELQEKASSGVWREALPRLLDHHLYSARAAALRTGFPTTRGGWAGRCGTSRTGTATGTTLPARSWEQYGKACAVDSLG